MIHRQETFLLVFFAARRFLFWLSALVSNAASLFSSFLYASLIFGNQCSDMTETTAICTNEMNKRREEKKREKIRFY